MGSNSLLIMFNLSSEYLSKCSKQIYSQSNQDGVLEAMFNQIGVEHFGCMEFGAGDGEWLSNTLYMKERFGMVRLLYDANPKSDIVEQSFITVENVSEIVKLSYKLAYLSIDLDGNDYWIWEAIENKPSVVTIEYNSKFRNDESYAIEYNENHVWQGDDYYGASLLALKKLGERKGYTLVHVVGALDAVFVRNDLLGNGYVPPTIEELLPEPMIVHKPSENKKWVEIK